VSGKQYIVVAISGGLYSGEYLALKLPVADRTSVPALDSDNVTCYGIKKRRW
jgi:hypothetical protein